MPPKRSEFEQRECLTRRLKRRTRSTPILNKALAYSTGVKGGRPPYDPVAMFKILILTAQNNVSDARMEI